MTRALFGRVPWPVAGVILVTLIGLALRLVALDAESAWTDEMYSLYMARAPLGDLVSGAVRDPGNPLGYYVLLHGWLELCGDSVASARVFSALTGTLAIPLTALFARRVTRAEPTSWAIVVIAAALVAASPPLVYLGREARVFALATSVVLVHALAAQALATSASGARARDWILYVASAVALLYLHYFSVFVLLAVGVWLGFVRWQSRARLWPWLVAVLVVVAAFLPYLPTLAWQIDSGMARTADSWWKHALFMPGYALTGHTLVWIDHGAVALAAVFTIAIAGVWAPALWVVRTRIPGVIIALGIGATILAIHFALVAPLVNGRYASITFPALAILLALALGRARRRLRWLMASALAALTIAALVGLYRGGHKDDWRALAARVEADAEPIYTTPHEARRALQFYLPDRAVQAIAPATIDAAALRARLEHDGGRAWFVLYAYDPRVAARPERALAELGDDVVQTVVIGDRRLRLIHLDLLDTR